MQANRLTRITGLEALPQLQELYVSENGISELSGLEAQVRRTAKIDLWRSLTALHRRSSV